MHASCTAYGYTHPARARTPNPIHSIRLHAPCTSSYTQPYTRARRYPGGIGSLAVCCADWAKGVNELNYKHQKRAWPNDHEGECSVTQPSALLLRTSNSVYLSQPIPTQICNTCTEPTTRLIGATHSLLNY